MRKSLIVAILVSWLGIFGVQAAQSEYIDNGVTVTDTVTGLEWQKATAGTMTWDNAMGYADVLTLNSKSDWRLLSFEEMRTVDQSFFSSWGSYYWLSNTEGGNINLAMKFQAGSGWAVYVNKSNMYSVRAVRGGQSESLRDLVISRNGTGFGTVTSLPAGIDCGDDCSESYLYNTAVTMIATPSTGSTFTDWSGDADCSNENVDMITNKNCTATFVLNSYSVTPSASAHGTIDPAVVQTVNHGSTNVFTVTPEAGYTASVGGTCNGTLVGSTYTTNAITANCTVAATFTLNAHTLEVTKSGTGNGTTTGAGIYDYGTTQAITATADTNSTFKDWSGDCSGTTSPFDVLMNSNKTCTATFTLNQYTLAVNTAGTGAGTVGGSGTYDYGTTHQATATPDTGSIFTGWSGDCSGTVSPFDVLINDNKTCTATFALNQHPLTVNKTGAGTVTSVPAGIDCGANCSECYDTATEITLTAVSAKGGVFIGWLGGGCTGTEDCTVTMDDQKEIYAVFKNSFPWAMFLPVLTRRIQ